MFSSHAKDPQLCSAAVLGVLDAVYVLGPEDPDLDAVGQTPRLRRGKHPLLYRLTLCSNDVKGDGRR